MRGTIGGFAEAISALAFSTDGHSLAVGGQGRGGLSVIDLAGHKIAAQDRGYVDTIEWIAYAADGRLATSSADGKIRLYDAGLKPIATAPLAGDNVGSDRPWGLAFSPDGSRLAVGSLGAAKLRLFTGDQLKPVKTLDGAAERSGRCRSSPGAPTAPSPPRAATRTAPSSARSASGAPSERILPLQGLSRWRATR